MKLKYEVIRHGLEHDQFFPGAGVAGTAYDKIVTGAGDTEREAGNEAMDDFMESIDLEAQVVDVTALDNEIEALPSVEGGFGENTHYYVSIAWKMEA